jgi:hypothetical protein
MAYYLSALNITLNFSKFSRLTDLSLVKKVLTAMKG